MKKVEIQAEILAMYYGSKKSARRIARELGIDRKTVASIITRRTVALAPRVVQKGSILDPYKEQISELQRIDPFISAATVHQRLRLHGFMGGVSIVRQWMAKQRKKPLKAREAFFRLEFSPGECAQVDWGEFGDVFGDGVKIHCFVMVLAYSRLMYLEFTRSEKFEEFIRCHENGFRFFGGKVPRECWYDNLASAVSERSGALIRFNSRFMTYIAHHGIQPHACNPARGNEKGRVEDGVKYIRSSFWAGRKFTDFEALCTQASLWRDGIANRREHRSTRKVPILHFDAEEKQALRSMNPHPFDTREVFTRIVPPNFHVAYEANFYSVPWSLVGLPVTLKVNHQSIEIFYQECQVTSHARSYRKHQYFTNPQHSKGLQERKPGQAKESWQLQAAKAIGPKMGQYLELLSAGNRSLRNELSKILALATVYGETQVHQACEELLAAGIIGVENLELSLKSSRHQSEQDQLLPKPIEFQNSKLNRVVPTQKLTRYDALLKKREDSAENPTVLTQGDDDEDDSK